MALVLTLLLLLAPSIAHGATTYYVMSDGSSNTTGPADDCSVANLNATVVFTSDGDTIICGAGTYSWSGAGSSWSGTAGTSLVQVRKAITIKGAGTIPSGGCGYGGDQTGCGAATSGGTRLDIDSNASVTVFDFREPTTGSITLANFHFYIGATTAIPTSGIIGSFNNVTTGLAAKPTILHHITMEYHQGTLRSVLMGTMHGLIYRSKFMADIGPPFATGPEIQCKANSPHAQNNWARASTFGSQDTSANLDNLYVENNYFQYHSVMDNDDGCRAVTRGNFQESAPISGHGHDTSGVGPRHNEIYLNEFNCPDTDNWVSLHPARGGTSKIFNNIMPATCDGSATTIWNPQLQALRRLMKTYDYRVQTTATFTTASSTIDVASTVGIGVGMAACTPDSSSTACTTPINFIKVTAVNDGANQVTLQSAPTSNGTNATIRFDSCYPGQHPWSRQHGWGWDPAGTTPGLFNVNDQILEPVYIWNNTYTSGGTLGEQNSISYNNSSFSSFPDGPCAWPTFTGTLTSGSPTVTSISPGTDAYFVGMAITGTGIPASTTVSSVDSATQLTLSANATSSGSQSITLNNNNILTQTLVQEDREFYRDSTSNPNCVASGTDCTSGIGRGTRAQRPSGGTLTNGVGWWSTDQGGNWDTTNGTSNDGCLDVVVSGAWVNCMPYDQAQNAGAYTPALYPHTLATETGSSSSSDSGISGSLAPRGRPRWHGPHAKPDRRETP